MVVLGYRLYCILYLLFLSSKFIPNSSSNKDFIGFLLFSAMFVPFGILFLLNSRIGIIGDIIQGLGRMFIVIWFIVYYAFSVWAIIKLQASERWKLWALSLLLIWILSIIGCTIVQPPNF